jgi:hypothetical protein
MGLFDILSSVLNFAASATEKSMNDYDRKLRSYERQHPDSEQATQARAKFEKTRTSMDSALEGRYRRTDSDLEKSADSEGNPEDYQYEIEVPLSQAKSRAKSSPGVYVLYLNGQVMKCGRAAYDQGLSWRFTQYYNLKYDNRARKGEYWAVSPENRDSVVVSWQCCPASRCQELEYRLFQKYGKGPWAQRAPSNPGTANREHWELLI